MPWILESHDKFFVRWRDVHTGVTKTSLGFETKMQALAFEGTIKQQILRQKMATDRQVLSTSLGDALSAYAMSRPVNDETRRRYLNTVKRISKSIGTLRLMEVLPAQIDIYLAERRAELAYATFQNEVDFIRRFFTWAFESMMIGMNPTLQIKIRHIRYSAGHVLTYEEECRILTAANRYQTLKILLALDAGLRANDARHLKWENFDLKNRWLRLQVHKEYGRALMLPLTLRLLESINLHPRCGELLFTYEGKPIKDDFSKYVFKIRKATGIVFRHHDLRHTFYSRLRKASDHDLAEWCLGHIPAQGYAPPLPEEMREAFETMEATTAGHLSDLAISKLEETA